MKIVQKYMQVNNIVEGFYHPPTIPSEWFKSVKKEIWEENEYTKYEIDIKPNDIVLDCGANIGIFTKYALNKGAKHVYAFECDIDNYEYCKINIQENNTNIFKGYISDRFEDGHFNFQTIFNMLNLETIDFAKIDIEYWEYPLLLNIPIDILTRINQYAIEVHDIYNNAYKILQILEKFNQNGYIINFEQIHKNTNLGMIYTKKKNI
jgi:precorrin-6B methylase 2